MLGCPAAHKPEKHVVLSRVAILKAQTVYYPYRAFASMRLQLTLLTLMSSWSTSGLRGNFTLCLHHSFSISWSATETSSMEAN
jgi:hypothetical protein